MLYLHHLKEIYVNLPDWVKAPIAQIPPSVLLGKTYRQQKQFLKESATWNAKELKAYQWNQLVKVVEFAASTVPYYRDLFKKLQIPSTVQSIDQFRSIPLLTKEIVKEQRERMSSESIPQAARYPVTTGGSSGVPLKFSMDADTYGKEWAFVHDLIERYGLSPSDRKIGLRGVPFPHAEQGIYHQLNPIYRELQISPFHLTHENIKSIASDILKFRPRYLHGYPSSVSQFSTICDEIGLNRELKVKAILLVSETVYPHQLRLLQRSFDCPVISFYGHSERLIFAGTTPERSGYFTDPRYGYTELVDGELVGTGFMNMAMPMLRYQTGDEATLISGNEGQGVTSFSYLSEVKGRLLHETLIGRKGNPISLTALNMHSDLFENVRQFQFYQDTIGKADLRIVPNDHFNIVQEGKVILNAFREKVGYELNIELKLVEKVELTQRGKQMVLIQKLPVDFSQKTIQAID